MIVIRLKKQGKRNAPFYRIVAAESRSKLSGADKAILGFWKPDKNEVTLDKKALKDWVEKGAQVSPAVKKLI